MAKENEAYDFDELARKAMEKILEELAPETKVTEKLLSRLFTSTVKRLIAEVESGLASPGNISNAIRILNENNITMDIDPDTEEENELDDLLKAVIDELDDPTL